MTFIIRAAYFEISSNIIKGRIVPTVLDPSPWVYSQDFALYFLENYFNIGALIDAEARIIEQTIQDWRPPIRHYEIDFRQRPVEVISLADVLKSRDPFGEFLGDSDVAH